MPREGGASSTPQRHWILGRSGILDPPLSRGMTLCTWLFIASLLVTPARYSPAMFDFLFDNFLRDEGDVSVFFATSVFLAAAMLAYGLLALVRSRTSLKRRAAGITAALDEPTAGNGLA